MGRRKKRRGVWILSALLLFNQPLVAESRSETCREAYDVPPSHLGPFLSHFPNSNCTESLEEEEECWGYEEKGCSRVSEFRDCQDPKSYFNQADFGYVKGFRSTLKPVCESETSSLECSDRLTFCRGRNLFIDFRSLPYKTHKNLRYSMEVLEPGDIGGNCRLNSKRLNSQLEMMSPLQSWAPEMRNFVSVDSSKCDRVIEDRTFVVKLDATVNMYHHFCDFFNLYASLHVNSSENMFSDDLRILIWENQRYSSSLEIVWKAFTRYPLWDLNTFSGERVCFRDVVFPLLPRMVYGLFYNSPILPDCKGSSLFRMFSKYIPEKLQMDPPEPPNSNKLRVTILSRSTNHRKILNEPDLVHALEAVGKYEVIVARFTHWMNYLHQLKTIMNTDILVGIHGAGLAHMLFLPEWAVVLELTHCGDPSCYFDLTRLRGLKHLGPLKSALPEDEGHHPTMKGAHAKFTNYSFDPKDLVETLEDAYVYINNHTEFRKVNQGQNEDFVDFRRTEL